MIIYFSDGRLGNQIFQFVFLCSISNSNERILTFFMGNFFEIFEINNCNIKDISVKNRYVNFLIRKVIFPTVDKIFKGLAKFQITTLYEQKRDINKFPLPEYVVKKGYIPIKYVAPDFYQSERLFRKEILGKMKIKEKYLKEAKNIINSLPKDTEKVFIHIRRGDYVDLTFLGQKGIVLPKSYYLNAVSELNKEVRNPFYIFVSDDPDYVRDCFENIEPKYISSNSVGVDLSLMSLCEYGVCSNSTFSWWGAYLMKNRKKVIFPKYWFGWKQKIESHPGIYPDFATIIEVE
jgi:Glycosyl transferase family 11.